MTPGKPSSPTDRAPAGSRTSLGWTEREKEIIFRNLAARSSPADGGDVASAPAPRGARSVRLSPPRRRLDRGQIAVLAILVLTLLAFLVGALASTGRKGTSAPQVAARPPAGESRSATTAGESRSATTASVPSATAARSEATGPLPVPATASGGEGVVRAFYDALGRGDGSAASALVVAEKRSTRAFSSDAISRFYGGLREPLRLTAITPLGGDTFRVAYRYAAGRSRCDGAAVVTLTSRDGGDLIRSIRALDGC